jgi:hypothetical protein
MIRLSVNGVEFFGVIIGKWDSLKADFTGRLAVSRGQHARLMWLFGTPLVATGLTCAVVPDRIVHEIRPKETRCR